MKTIIKILLLTLFILFNVEANVLSSQKRLNSFNNFIETIKSKGELEKVVLVNKYFNNYTYASDKSTYKKIDYWATRDEFISKGKGDCEDFAIAKYFTLLDLGIPSSKIKLTIAKYKGQLHCVLAYSYNNKIFFLDNNTNNVSSKRNDLKILHTVKNDFKSATSLSEEIAIYKWKNVLRRI
jgi:predicted transglutaminase-like cysteine proteinase